MAWGARWGRSQKEKEARVISFLSAKWKVKEARRILRILFKITKGTNFQMGR